MFEREITLCKFLRNGLDGVAADIPEEQVYDRAPGKGHPPIWILGHLAICGELGEKFSGGEVSHPRWLPQFGPGSPDEIEDKGRYSKTEFVEAIHSSYDRFAILASKLPAEMLTDPHGVELLEGTPIATVGDLISHLFSSHFGFHLAQLSAWRRAAGHAALY